MQNLKNIKVLWVDDEPRILTSVKLCLSQFTLYTAESGQAAIEFLRTNPGEINVIVSDYNMTDGNGLEFKRYLSEKMSPSPLSSSVGTLTRTSP